jgi:hypothetical protein
LPQALGLLVNPTVEDGDENGRRGGDDATQDKDDDDMRRG